MRRWPALPLLVREAHLPRILVVYVSAAVGVLQTVDVLQDRLGLPDWCFSATLTLLLVGLPVVIATALVQAAHGRPRAAPALPPTPGGRVDASVPAGGEEAPPAGALVDGGRVARAHARAREGAHARVLTWRNVALAGGTAFGLLAFSTAGYMGLRVAGIGPAGTLLGKGVLQSRDRVVLADVVNHTSDRQLGAVVTEALRTQLEQSRTVFVVPAADVRVTLARMKQDSVVVLTEALAREVAQRLGAKAVVTGEIGAAGNGYLLSAHVLATDTAAPLVSVLETAEEPRRLIPAIDRLSGKVRERIGESLRSIRASPPLAQVTTSSLDALRLYSEASKLLDRSPGETERPLALLQAAVALDTGFAAAYRAMGVALLNSGFEHARGLAMLRRALEHSQRLPLVERYRAQAIYDWNRGEYERAAAGYRALLELNPTDAAALNNLGGTYADLGDQLRADSCFRRALQLDPASSVSAFNHALSLVELARYDSARAFLASYFGPRLDAPAL